MFFSYLATKEHFFTLSSTCAKVWRSWVRNDTDKDFWFFLSFELFMSHKSLIFVSVSRWNHYAYSPHSMPELSVDFFLMLVTFFSRMVPPTSLKMMSTDESNPFYKFYLFCGFCLMCWAGLRSALPTETIVFLSWLFWWEHWKAFNSL